MKRAIDWIIHSDIYVAFVAVGLGLTSYFIYDLPFADYTPLLITFLITLNIYAINRQTDQEIDEINLPERTSFVKRYGEYITTISVIGAAFSLVLAFSHSNFTGFATLFALFFGYVYSYSLFRIGRLKDQLIWKNIGVGLIYGFISLITLAYFDITNTIEIASMFMLFFINFFLISSFFDLRDVKGDVIAGIETIPVILKEKTMHFFHAINILPLLIIMVLIFYAEINFKFIYLGVFSTVYGMAYLFGHSLKLDMKFLCMVVADAQPMVVSLILLLTN